MLKFKYTYIIPLFFPVLYIYLGKNFTFQATLYKNGTTVFSYKEVSAFFLSLGREYCPSAFRDACEMSVHKLRCSHPKVGCKMFLWGVGVFAEWDLVNCRVSP